MGNFKSFLLIYKYGSIKKIRMKEREREREREQKRATTKIMFITASGLGEFHADKMHYQINVPVYLMVHKRINI